MIKKFFEVNDLIGEKLQSGEPFSCLRIDNTCGYVLHCMHRNYVPSPEFCNDRVMVEAGIVPTTTQYFYDTVMPKTLDLMK